MSIHRREMAVKTGEPTWPWYAVQVKSRYEQKVAFALENKGYQCFLPLYKTRRKWSDRIKDFALPLFPGYLFCRLDILMRLPILITDGVLMIVGTGKTPLPVMDSEIAALQAVVESGLRAAPWPFLRIGQRVRIEHGALQGVEGILIAQDRPHRLIVSVSLLQRSVSVEIDEVWATPIGSDVRTTQDAATPVIQKAAYFR